MPIVEVTKISNRSMSVIEFEETFKEIDRRHLRKLIGAFLWIVGLCYLMAKNLGDTVFEKRNDMSTTILQQILSGWLLLVVIVGLKK